MNTLSSTLFSEIHTPVLTFSERMIAWESKGIIIPGETTPTAEKGPITLIFEPLATYHAAKNEDVYGAGAVLVQNGVELARFSALAEKEFNALTEDNRLVAQNQGIRHELPLVFDTSELNSAFGDFLLYAWEIVWRCFEPYLIKKEDEWTDIHILSEWGLFQILSAGAYMDVENHFLRRCTPKGKEFKEVFAGKDRLNTYGVHPCQQGTLFATAVAKGYQPVTYWRNEAAELLGFPVGSENPLATAFFMAALLHAMNTENPKMAKFKIPSFGK